MNNSGPFLFYAHLKSFFPLGLQHMCPFLNSWLKEVQIIFKEIILKNYTTIFLLTSFLINLLIRIACA